MIPKKFTRAEIENSIHHGSVADQTDQQVTYDVNGITSKCSSEVEQRLLQSRSRLWWIKDAVERINELPQALSPISVYPLTAPSLVNAVRTTPFVPSTIRPWHLPKGSFTSITGACKSIQLISFLACVRYRQKLHGWSNYVSQAGDSISAQIKSNARACDQMVINRLKMDGVPHHNEWWHPSHAVAIRYAWNNLVSEMFEAVSDEEVVACEPSPLGSLAIS